MHYTLTVYQSDDSTVLFEVGTSASHPHPYLHVPGEMDLGEVDLLQGKAMIGQVNLRVIDPQAGATQAERWMTSRLGIPQGEDGAGHSALNGRRAALRRSDGRLVMDGVLWGVQLSDTAAGFHLQLRDIRERARKLPLFRRTGTSSVLPRGVIDGYGKLPNGGWLIPPTQPLRADVTSAGLVGITLDFLAHHWQRKDKKWWAIPDLVLTDDIRSAVQTEVTQGPDFGFGAGPSYRCPLVTVLWRYVGDTTWQELRAPIPASSVIGGAPLLSTQTAHLPATADRESMVVEAIRGIRLASILQAPLPVSGMGPVEVILRYDGPPSEAYPYHYEGPAGELIRNAMRGDYSSGPSKLRYDEAAVLALTTPVRVRLTKPVEDARPWLEQAHQQLGAAPALDSQGRISPVLAALPPTDAPLPVITEQNATAIPGWEHPADGAVTSVAVRYQRDYLVRAIDDPLGERSAGDGIASIDVTVEHAAPEWARDLMGDHPLEIDGWLFRAIGGSDGDPVTGDVIDEAGAQASRRLGYLFIDRFLFGGQTSFVRVKEDDFPGLREGSWVIDERPWRPNYREGRRGGSTLAQVVSIRAAAPGWLDLRLIDAGPLDQPLTTPAIGPLAATDTGGVRIPVTSVPTGAEVAVYYAISPTPPPADSGLWTFAGRTGEVGAIETPPVPAGARVYARARSEAPGRRPSAWTALRQITMPIVPRVSGVRAEIDDDGEAVVRWEPNPHAAGVRIYYAIYDVGDPEPDLVTFIDQEADGSPATIPVPVGATQVLLVDVEPWTGWTGSAVSGSAGPRVGTSVAANRTPPVEPQPEAGTFVRAVPRWSTSASETELHLHLEWGLDTKSVRIRYTYASTPGGAPDTVSDYILPIGEVEVVPVHPVEQVPPGSPRGIVRIWSPLDPPPKLTLTPYSGVGGTGEAGREIIVAAEDLTTAGPGIRIGAESGGGVAQADRILAGSGLALSLDLSGRPVLTVDGDSLDVVTELVVASGSGLHVTGSGGPGYRGSVGLSVAWADGQATLNTVYRRKDQDVPATDLSGVVTPMHGGTGRASLPVGELLLGGPSQVGTIPPTQRGVLGATGTDWITISGGDGQWLRLGAGGPYWDTLDASSIGAVPSTRQVIAGVGLTGGGELDDDVTLDLAFDELDLRWKPYLWTPELADLPTITPGKGGTGRTSVAAGRLLVGAGTSTMTELAPGAAGGFVRSNGSAWVRSAIQGTDVPWASGVTPLSSYFAEVTHTHDAADIISGEFGFEQLPPSFAGRPVAMIASGTPGTPAGAGALGIDKTDSYRLKVYDGGWRDVTASADSGVTGISTPSGGGLAISGSSGPPYTGLVDLQVLWSDGFSTLDNRYLRRGVSGTLEGALTLLGTTSRLYLDTPAGGSPTRGVAYRRDGANLWMLYVDAATDFRIMRYNDVGTNVGDAIRITRSDGLVTFQGTPRVGSTPVSLEGHTHPQYLQSSGDVVLNGSLTVTVGITSDRFVVTS